MYADLHIHTLFSDGTLLPSEAAELCLSNGVSLAAVADHNTWLGSDRFDAACRGRGIETIRACEFSCNWHGLHLHILGYRFDATPELEAVAARSHRLMLDMSADLIDKMSADHPEICRRDFDSYIFDRSRGGWAGINYLADTGVISSPEAGFALYSRYGCEYADYPFPQAEEVCAAVRAAGGVPVLAHPGNWFNGAADEEVVTAYRGLADAGIAGIECFYPANSERITKTSVEFCRSMGLWITAGCDCHGDFCKSGRNGVKFEIAVTKTPVSSLYLGE